MANQEGLFCLDISEDGMQAQLVPVSNRYGTPTLESLICILREHNIIEGVKKDRLKQIAVEGFQSDDPVVVAEGLPPLPGLDAEIIFCFRHENLELSSNVGYQLPKTRESGFMNFKVAKKNEVLAVKLRNTDGEPGKDVFGRKIPPEKGNDKRLIAGKNIQLRYYPDKIEYSGLSEGIVQLKNDCIELSAQCIIDHDIDLSIGNVEFNGDVLIHGSVHAGLIVKSLGSITVKGKIEGGILKADGDISVTREISKSSSINAGGCVRAQSINHSYVEASGDVDGGEAIIHSEIISGGRITATEGRGVILGGTLKSRNGLEANLLGSILGTATHIIIGEEFIEKRKFQKLETDLMELDKEIERMQSALQPFLSKDPTLRNFPPDKKWILRRLMNRLQDKRHRRQQTHIRLSTSEHNGTIRKPTLSECTAYRNIHSGVSFQFGSKMMNVDHELSQAVVFQSVSTKEIVVEDIDQSKGIEI